MRLILVHGINQQGKDPVALEAEWMSHLRAGAGYGEAFGTAEVSMPFYGNLLQQWTRGTPAGFAIAQGPDGQPDQAEAEFMSNALLEAAEAAGISSTAILKEQRLAAREADETGVVAQSLLMNRRLNAIVRLLEKLSPLHGDVTLRLLRQAFVYLKKPGAGAAIDAEVLPLLAQPAPAVIVAHSLGTVVAFKLLRELALSGRTPTIPLLVTVGSPLPIMAVQAALGPDFLRPPGVAKWINAIDPDDFITLGRGLDALTFADGIENIVDVENSSDNPHYIGGYLSDSRVATAVAEACAP